MQLPLLRHLKRLLPFLLGIGTTLLILGFSLHPITAQQAPVSQDPPAFGTPLEPPKSPNTGGLWMARFPQHWGLGGEKNLNEVNLDLRTHDHLDKTDREDLIAQASPTSPTLDLVQQAKAAYQKGQLNQAITLWQQAAAAFATQSDHLHQGMTLSYLAQAYQQLGAWDNARTAIAQSLALLNQPNQGSTGDRLRILAEAQTIQGSLQLDQGQASEAFASWQQAAQTFQKAGDQASVIRSQINQSQALLTLGLYKRANDLLASLYAKQPPDAPLRLAILLNYGETLRLVGHLNDEPAGSQTSKPAQSSEAVLLQGLALAQTLASPVDITKAQLSLGNTYRALYQQQKRLQTDPCPDPKVVAYRQKALQSYQAAADSTNAPTSKIQAWLNQQSLLLLPLSDSPSNAQSNAQSDTATISAGQAAQVVAIADQIQAQLDRLPLNRTALYARIQLAYNLLKLDQTPSQLKALEPKEPGLKASGTGNQAVQLLGDAAKQAETLGDRSAQSYALGYLGQVYAQQQAVGEAQKLTTQALALAKESNTPELTYRWFWQLGRLDRATNPERAIKNYRAAYQTLQTFRLNLATANPDLQFSFRQSTVDLVYREFVALLLQPQTTGTKAARSDQASTPAEAHLKEARQVIQDLQSAELSNFLQEPCALSNLEAIDKRVDEQGSSTATLYPILLPDRIEVIAKFPGKPLFHDSYPIAEADVRQKIGQFQFDLQESYTFDAVKKEGQEIYQWLIPKAIQEALENTKIKTLVFALDGSLRNIPMAALHDGSGYLIEKYAVAVTLDLVVTDPKALPSHRLNVLAASLAKPPKQKDKVKFAPLPYVDAEVKAIQETAGVTVTPIQDDKFTRALFNQKFNDAPFEIVHLATHGQFSSNPEETFILTAAGRLPDGNPSDGKVRLNDFDAMFRTRVLNRPDAIDLLILSACETAAGDDRATLGIAGAAVRAGARSAIASLWSLDDQSSQQFMKVFYNTITQPNTSRAEALQKAQLSLLQDEYYAHPRYWAPFLLVGNWL